MSTPKIVPCIWMNDQAEEAASFYTKTFPGGRIVATAHYPNSSDNPSGRPRGSVLTVEFEIEGTRFTALNGGPIFSPNPSISFFVHVASAEEADRLFGVLADRGSVLMPIGSYPWSERYGWVKDRFGVSWQVMSGRPSKTGSKIVPCLMFTGREHGKAEDAMRAYTTIFPNARIESVERYAKGEGPEGTVKHGRFLLADQEMVAMDSHVTHGVSFDEGLSLQVMCKDQSEVDRYWALLSKDGGQPGQCGWLKDRFGLSWQVVPSSIATWMTSRDEGAKERAFEAVMHMRKLDIDAIDRAFRGV